MSRFGDEDLDALDADIPCNASCADCGLDYSKAEDDPTPWCDSCSDRRDQWADAYQLRMAKASRPDAAINMTEDRCVCGVRVTAHMGPRGRRLSCLTAFRRAGVR